MKKAASVHKGNEVFESCFPFVDDASMLPDAYENNEDNEEDFMQQPETDAERDSEPEATDVVKSVSRYKQLRERHDRRPDLRELYRNEAVEKLLHDYHYGNGSAQDKAWLRDEIFFRVFFLLPYAARKAYYLSSDIFDDAMQHMSVNLLTAIEHFNPSLGCSLTNYLVGYIKAALTRTFVDTNVVRVPSARRKLLMEILDCSMHRDREGDDAVVSLDGLTNVPLDRVGYYDWEKINPGLFPSTEEDPLAFEEILHNRQLVDWLEEAVSAENGLLTEDERRVLVMSYGLFGTREHSYAEIARMRKAEGKGHAHSRLSQIRAKATRKLTEFFAEARLEEY